MRILDLATAGVIGLLSLSFLLVSNPSQYDTISAASSRQASLRDFILAFLRGEGLPKIENSSFGELCKELVAHSNSSILLSATMGQSRCQGSTPSGDDSADLVIPLGDKVLVITAWSSATR